MPKLGMEPMRRIEAINATLECIYECGIDRITLDMVAEKAGFSKGIVTYYFKSKKNLVLETLKAFLAAYNLKIGASVKEGSNPLDMVKAVVESSASPRGGPKSGNDQYFYYGGSGENPAAAEKNRKDICSVYFDGIS